MRVSPGRWGRVWVHKGIVDFKSRAVGEANAGEGRRERSGECQVGTDTAGLVLQKAER